MSSAADPTATFLQYLRDSGLLTAAQWRELGGWVAHQKPDLKALAADLARRGWLTLWQIKEVAKNRGAGLKVKDQYVLLDVLGEGGMGRVYKAHNTRMGRDVAFKVIRKEKLSHPVVVERFEQEIQALARMPKHPNVVEVFNAEQIGDHHFCEMEFIDGSDLTKLVRAGGPMAVPQACDAIRQAALGLEHARLSGLVHRDIKPSNIIVPNGAGPVKLVDLGLARLLNAPGGEEAQRITQEGFVIGTPDFLAPEQARNPMAVDIRADVYALGGTLFYILTGRVPYEGANPTEKLLKHCTEPPPNLLAYRPDAPPALQQLIHWCMAKRPEDRPQVPMQLAVALQPFCPPPPPGTGAFALPPPGHFPAPAPYPMPAAPRPVPAAPYPAYPPAYPPPGAPLPIPDPSPSSQVFRLPPQTTDADPIRRRSEGAFPTGAVLLGLGALFVVGVLGFAAYRIFVRAEAAGGTPDPFTNTQGMKMVRVDGGTFRMGSPDTEPGRRPDEGPVREVTIRGPLFVSATEVTNGQFLKVMGRSESYAAKYAARPEYLPVDSVTWDEANEFCRLLTEKERGQVWWRKDWEYRLPTEAEWEYACRAGADAPFAFGAGVKSGEQGVFRPTDDDSQGVGGEPNKPPKFPQEVGKAEANRFGLHDMHGNVAEWCADWYRSEAYKDGGRDNPTGPTAGSWRVLRGGSFREPAAAARSAARDKELPNKRHERIGFRPVYAPIVK